MRVCHNVSAVFDDPNLIGTAGLVPVLGLAEKAGLPDLVAEHVTVAGSAGANADLKIGSLVAGMIAGADSIQDMDLVRHGGMGRVFTGHRAPTTLGTHLRAYTFGHVRQLDAVGSRVLVNPVCHEPPEGRVRPPVRGRGWPTAPVSPDNIDVSVFQRDDVSIGAGSSEWVPFLMSESAQGKRYRWR